MKVECPSVVSRVVVHARGALVTREVTLPDDLVDGAVDIEVSGVTPMAELGGVRAALEGSERSVLAVRAAVVIPSGPQAVGPTVARVRELNAKLQRLNDEHRVLGERRNRLVELVPTPRLRTADGRHRQRDAFDARFDDALAMGAMLDEKITDLDRRIGRIETEKRELSRTIAAAKLEDSQASSRARMGGAHPYRTITTRLIGTGRPGKLHLTYAVMPARWWPTYTLRIASDSGDVVWTFEAIVAQNTGEDWDAVALSLSSADLVFDAHLPELTSLRFGRRQEPARRPFRPPPTGVEEMFRPYLAFGVGAFRDDVDTRVAAPAYLSKSAPMEPTDDDGDGDEEDTAVNALALPMAELGRTMAPRAEGFGGGAPPPPPPAPMLASAPAPGGPPPLPPPPRAAAGFFAQQAAPAMPMKRRAASETGALGMVMDDAPHPQLEEEEERPSEAWNDFDRLVLAPADDPRRGRLVARGGGRDDGAAMVATAVRDVNAAASARYRDPAETRGMFDHRYEAASRADVPADARVHRVMVGTERCPVRIAWRAVPSETAEVFREAHVTSAWPTALLGGPVDVYLDGTLIAATHIDRIDRGGVLFCGMGADDRLKIARNVRVAEESAGLLGGSIAVTHHVEIELQSTIRDPVKVTVLERVPISDDKALEVKLLKATPLPDTYDQADRGAPIRGGCRFEVTVAPAKKTTVELVYRLVFPQKLDVVGGSRRG